MPPLDPPKASLHARALEELRAFLLLAAYLYVCLGALLLLKAAILEGAGIAFTAWGVAAVKSLVLAKFMLLGRALHIGERLRYRPLIWPTLYRSGVFLILLLGLTAIEEIIVGFLHGRDLASSLAHVVGPTLPQGLAVSLIMFLILLPYFAFCSLGEVLGEGTLVRLFLIDRDFPRGPA